MALFNPPAGRQSHIHRGLTGNCTKSSVARTGYIASCVRTRTAPISTLHSGMPVRLPEMLIVGNAMSISKTQCADHNRNPRKLWHIINTVTSRTRQRLEPTCDVEDVATAFSKVVTDADRPPVLTMPQGQSHPTAFSTFRYV